MLPYMSARNTKFISVLIIGVIIIGGGGFLIWQEFRAINLAKEEARAAEDRAMELRKNNTQEPGNPENLDTSSWQTYRNEKYGFEFRYVPNWYVFENQHRVVVMNVQEVGKLSEESLENEARFSVSIRQNNNPGLLSINEWLNNLIKNGVSNLPLLRDPVSVSGRRAVLVEVPEVGMNIYYIFIPSGTDIIEIAYPSQQEKFSATYEKILSTLRFID